MRFERVICALCLVFLCASFSSANFACGEVHSDGDVSPAWMNVLVYYDVSPQDAISCSVTGENKFCCDLDLIESVNWSSGLTVWSEIYDPYSKFVSQKESLITSDSAYDLFSPLIIHPAIDYQNNLRPFILLIISMLKEFLIVNLVVIILKINLCPQILPLRLP
jgi:hypothetical protein